MLTQRYALLAMVLAALLFSMPAAATSKFGACGQVAVADAVDDASFLTLGPNSASCFYFDAAENSAVFNVIAPTALITLRPDVGAEGNGSAAIMVARCIPGVKVYSATLCGDILTTALDGTGGASATQTMSIRVARGSYAIVNDTTANSDEAIVAIEAE